MLIRKGREEWDKGEGVRRWGGGLGQGGGSRGWVKGLAGGYTSSNLMHIFYITPEVDLN